MTRGFPVGFVAPPAFEGGRKMHFLYNHVRIVLKYHEDPAVFAGARIVGFQIIPFSINHMWDRLEDFDEYTTTLSTCNEMNPAQNDPGNFQSVEEADEVIYTYDVKWVPSDITWAHRWDVYLKVPPLHPSALQPVLLPSYFRLTKYNNPPPFRSRQSDMARAHRTQCLPLLSCPHSGRTGQPRRRDPLLQHRQLADDRALPDGRGGHDHAPHPA